LLFGSEVKPKMPEARWSSTADSLGSKRFERFERIELHGLDRDRNPHKNEVSKKQLI
jgi:hypothetical protein